MNKSPSTRVLIALVVAACGESAGPPARPDSLTVTSVNPATGALAGGTPVTITGSAFVNVIAVTIGGAPLGNRVVASSTTITGTAPAATSPGAKDVVVSSSSYGSGTCHACFAYDAPVASVTVTPEADSIVVGDTIRLNAVLKDNTGQILAGREVVWTTDNAAIAMVSGAGLVTAVAVDTRPATITATSEGVSGSSSIAVMVPVRYQSLNSGAEHTCGLTVNGAINCWGNNARGQLGDGSKSATGRPHPAKLTGEFALLRAAGFNTCALDAGGAAYCWGDDSYGTLGAGAPGADICTNEYVRPVPCSTQPLAVTGAPALTTLAMGWETVCGLSASGSAYCWGANSVGGLGIGADTTGLTTCYQGPITEDRCSRTPRAVAGGLTFTALALGNFHVCGLTTGGAAYCWGANDMGQLGIGVDAAPDSCGAIPCSRTPIAVGGGLTFSALTASEFHTCGKIDDGSWYCWGFNDNGQLGNGTTGPEVCHLVPPATSERPCSSTPVRVSVGTFATVFAGLRHSCGLTPDGTASCWGFNVGQFGTGDVTGSLTPRPVVGGISFASLSLYAFHTCAPTTDGVPYCWGLNGSGQLGDGTTSSRYVPTRVLGTAR